MNQKHMVLVPYWVENVLKRDRIPFTALLDYSKMRAAFSVRELSAFLSLQRTDKLLLARNAYLGHLLSSWEQSAPPDARAELVSVVVPLSYSQDVVDEVMDRMVGDTSETADATGELWRIDDFERDSFALVLQRGAYESTSIPDKGLVLARRLMKLFYDFLEVHEVSSLPLFKHYLGLLRVAG